MSKTIDDFRNFLKPKRAKAEFRLLDALNTAKNILQTQLKNHSIELLFDVDDIVIAGNKNEFEQVALNLINNSKDAIMEKQKRSFFEGKIKVIAKEEDGIINIIFCDNGGGIPEGSMVHIFSPYFTSKGEKGTGIGLYIVKLILENSFGASIEVANKENGAHFLIKIQKEKHNED